LKPGVAAGSNRRCNVLNSSFIQSTIREPYEAADVLDARTIILQDTRSEGANARVGLGAYSTIACMTAFSKSRSI
jgi:hypothetical protein